MPHRLYTAFVSLYHRRGVRPLVLTALAFAALVLLFPAATSSWADTATAGAPAAGAQVAAAQPQPESLSLSSCLSSFARTTGLWDMTAGGHWKQAVMVLVGFLLLYLGVVKDFEPLLLVPIGFGTMFVNVPLGGMGGEEGFMTLIFDHGIRNEVLPLIVFMGIGSLCDFGPLLACPRVAILGAAAQFGVFGTLLGVAALNLIPGFDFTIKQACSIAIIGAADGPTSIIVASKYAPEMLGSIAVAGSASAATSAA